MEVLRNFSRKFFGINREKKSEVINKEPPSRKRPLEEEEEGKQTKDSLNHPIGDLHNNPSKRPRMSNSREYVPNSNSVHATPSPVQAVFAKFKSWFSVKSSPDLVECTPSPKPVPHTIQAAPPTLYSSAKLDTDEVELLKVVNPKLDQVKDVDLKSTEVTPLLQAADKLAAFAGFTSAAATPPPPTTATCPGKGGHSITTAHDKARKAALFTPENIRSRLHAGYRSTYDKFYHAKDIAQRGSVKKAKQNAFQYSADLADKMRYKALLERHTGNPLVKYNAWTKETSIMLNNTSSRKGPVRGALDGASCVDNVDATKMVTSTVIKPRLTSTAIKTLTEQPSTAKPDVEASPVLGREKISTPAPRHSALKAHTPGTPTVFSNRTQVNISGLNWPSNTLEQQLSCEEVCSPDYLAKLHEKYGAVARETARKIQREEEKKLKCQKDTEEVFKSIDERLEAHLKITQVAIPEDEVEEGGDDLDQPTELPDLTPHMKEVIRRAERSRGEVLVDAHKIQITVKDINTLKGLNWLNDEVINFYMQMIVTRSSSQDNLPSVYACTTFFYPKLKDGGHASVKRWTKKVDIFSHALVLIPVHLGMHWCLATIDMQRKAITYYDSMGGNNKGCLIALADYVKEEHLAKKGVPIDMTKWTQVIAKEIPQQMNGSDCGMFTCKFAEYISRRARFTFGQRDMPYFRQRMIYEIVKNQLLHP